MIETPFGNIHGIDDETITMLDLRNLFKAIDEGIVFQMTYREDTKPYKPKSFEVSKVVRCKNCKHGEPGACGDGVDCDGVWHDDDWFCADGEPKEGEEHG